MSESTYSSGLNALGIGLAHLAAGLGLVGRHDWDLVWVGCSCL